MPGPARRGSPAGLLGVPRHPLRAAKALPRLADVLSVPGANAFPVVPRLRRGLARLRGIRRTTETEPLRTFPVSVIVDGVGLSVTVLSYRDHVDVGIVAHRGQMEDLWSLPDGMRRALDELEDAVAAAA